jgi:hypothetical protein
VKDYLVGLVRFGQSYLNAKFEVEQCVQFRKVSL